MKLMRRSTRFSVEPASDRFLLGSASARSSVECASDRFCVHERSTRFLNYQRGFRVGNDEGSVESALTLIPLMILFLTVTQVGIAVYSRSAYDQVTQGATAYRAFGGTPSDTAASPSPQSSFTSPLIALPLPGGGSILVGERSVKLPGITPLLPSGDAFNSTGIAVQE